MGGRTGRRRGATSGNIVTGCPYRRAGACLAGVQLRSAGLRLQEPQVFQLYRGRYEADVAALLHQSTDPPVVVVLLLRTPDGS